MSRRFSLQVLKLVGFTRGDFRFAKNAAGELIIGTDNASEDFNPLQVRWTKEIDVITEVTGVDGVAAAGWISPQSAYDEDDVGKFLIEQDVEKHIIREFHAGHSRVVTLQTLADRDGELDADGADVTTNMFRGFYRRPGRVPAADRTDGSWFATTGTGDFEIQDPSGTHSSENWVNYNPFEAGEPWADIVDAGGDTITHVPFVEDGYTDDWRIVQTAQHAMNLATSVGEAFVATSDKKIYMVVAYTAHLDDDVKFRAVPYKGPEPVPDVSGDVDVTTANTFVDTGFSVPEAAWFYFNIGAAAAAGALNREWHRVRTEQLLGRTVTAAGTLIANATVLSFTDIAVGGSTTDVYLGYNAAGNLLFTTSMATVDARPLQIAV